MITHMTLRWLTSRSIRAHHRRARMLPILNDKAITKLDNQRLTNAIGFIDHIERKHQGVSIPLRRNLGRDTVLFDHNQRQQQQRGACSGCPDGAAEGVDLSHHSRSNLPSLGHPGDIHGFREKGKAVAVVAAAGQTRHRDCFHFQHWILARLKE